MTARDCIIAALQRRIPDRLPVMELAIDQKVVSGLGYSDYFDMVEGLDLNAVFANEVVNAWGVTEWIDRKRGIFRDIWGTIRQKTEESVPMPIDFPLKDKARLHDFQPPEPQDDPILTVIPELIRHYQGKRMIAMLGRAVFNASWYLRGMEDYLMDLCLHPELVDKIGRIVVEYNKELHRLAIKAGVELIVLGDDYAYKTGPLMSPAQFRAFIYPGLKEVVQNIKSHGAFCIKHTDGNIWSIIDLIVETGVDGIGPLEPAAAMDLAQVKRQYGDRVCVVGNIDVDLLCRGTSAEVADETRRLIRDVTPGGHILSSGNSITSPVIPNNFRVMVETARNL